MTPEVMNRELYAYMKKLCRVANRRYQYARRISWRSRLRTEEALRDWKILCRLAREARKVWREGQ